MAFQKVMISGINTADLTVLKEEEKMALLREIRDTGSKAAKDKLIQGNLRLVLSVIQRFTGRGEDIDDLFQIGVVGLIKAINNFDLSKEVRFSTYCVPMISGELRRYLRDFNQIKVSRSLRDLAYQAMQAKERLTTNLQKEPTVSEIAAEIGAKRKMWWWHWRVSANRFPFMSRYIPNPEMHCMCWIKSANGILWKTGWENFLCEMPYDSWEHGNRTSYISASFRGKPRQKWQRKSAFHRHRFPVWKKMQFYRCGMLPICITIHRDHLKNSDVWENIQKSLCVRRESAWAYPTKSLARHTVCLRNFYAICRKI